MHLTALSQLYVAFTLEWDDVFEQRMPHRTSRGPAAGSRGVWLVSRAMWANHLRWLPAADDAPLARLTNPAGLRRWGYLAEDGSLRPGGVAANRVADSLTAEVEERWERRFGSVVGELRAALRTLADPALPWALPVVGRRSTSGALRGWTSAVHGADDEFPTLVARTVMRAAFAMERRSRVPLHLTANALRVIPTDGMERRQLPRAAGISREAAAMSLGWLRERGLITTDGPAVLTAEGVREQAANRRTEAEVDEELGLDAAGAAARGLLKQTDALIATVRLDERGWRAHPPYLAATRAVLADPRASLPHFPMCSIAVDSRTAPEHALSARPTNPT